MCPESAAWATKTRLDEARVIAAANKSAGRTVVRALKILTPGTVPAREPADTGPEPAAKPAGPVRTRETASDGYHRALAALQEATPPRRVDPAIAEAVERQTAAMRSLSLLAFPEPEQAVGDIEQARVERRRQADASHAPRPCTGPARNARPGRPRRPGRRPPPRRGFREVDPRPAPHPTPCLRPVPRLGGVSGVGNQPMR